MNKISAVIITKNEERNIERCIQSLLPVVDEVVIVDSIELCKDKKSSSKKDLLLAEKAYRLIQSEKMKNINKKELIELISKEITNADFNLYKIIERYF